MTNREKAQAGLKLLKEAVLGIIRENPNGITNAEIARALNIESSDEKNQQKNWLSKSIYYCLLSEGKVHQKEPRGPFFPK